VGQVVGKVGQRGQADAQHHFQRLLVAEAGGTQGLQLGIGHIAARGDHAAGKAGQGFQSGVGQGLAGAQRLHHGRVQLAFAQRSRVRRHTEMAAMGGAGHQLHHLALAGVQAGAHVQAGDRHIGFQCRRRLGQHADKVRQKTHGLLRFFQQRADGLGAVSTVRMGRRAMADLREGVTKAPA
jgi:hypothetical protein